MIGIIPIMGTGQRFKDAGYTTPKHLLEVSPGVTILEKIISSFNGEPVYIGCRPEYFEGVLEIIKAGGYNVHVYSLNYDVLSAIETTLKLLDHIYCNYQPIVVHYCDVFIPEGLGKLIGIENWLPAALIPVDTDDPRFTRTKYGDKGIGGIYLFQNKGELIKRIKNNPNAKTMGEVTEGDFCGFIDRKQIDIGTPEAYREYLNTMNGIGG
jgi:NDP-sugar pyrophosphorylase family protein